ncbi:MAG: hypothetical protein M1837_004846 [Sclerophora amabilis]|nr:MAG: hypothetical protein M1837_004846 [Sclerophora amabilis]
MEVPDIDAMTPDEHATSASIRDERATNQRKSGRVVKRPEVYTPEANVLTNGSGGKRKRINDNAGDDNQAQDASLESVSSSGEDPAEDAHEEEVKEKRRRITKSRKGGVNAHTGNAKPAKAGKPRASRTKTSTNGLAFRGKRGQAGQNPAANAADGLHDVIFVNGTAPDQAGTEWLSRYEYDKFEAMRDMVNFILRLTGCTFEVSVHDIEDVDNATSKLSDLQEEYQAQMIVDYPLISKTKSHPQVRPTIIAFFDSLIASLDASGALYTDLALLENIETWVTAMTSSAIRPFRHTATLIALTIVSSLCDVVMEMADADAKSLRQLETEKKKGRGNKGRITALEDKINEGGEKREMLEGKIKDIFDAVFVHRYRDVDPRIRAECIQGLGYWILKLPDIFFEGSYLRYLGWVLSDTSAPTRLEVIKQLQRLFKKKENIGGLRTFTERFRSRLVEMATRDAELSVRTQTVELLDLVREAGLLEPDDIDTIGRLIFDSDLRLRKAVVGFFAQNIDDLYESKIEDLGGEDAIDETFAGNGDEDFDKPRISWLKLKCLVEVLQSYDVEGEEPLQQIERGSAGANDILIAAGVESRFSLATQALYEHVPEIKEWEVLAGYLLFDHSEIDASSSKKRDDIETSLKKECKLDEREEIILLNVLNTAVILSLTQFHEADTTSKGKKKKALNIGSLEGQEDLARHLSQLIPRLLNKFGAVPAAASTVLRLEHVLDLDVFHQLRQDATNYSALLDDINKQFMTHGDQAVLVEASAALLHARGFEDLEEVTGEKVQSLWEDTMTTLQSLLKGKGSGNRGDLSLNTLTSLLNSVRRLSNLASIADCTEILEQPPAPSGKKRKSDQSSLAPIMMLIDLLKRSSENQDRAPDSNVNELEDDLMACSMKAILFYFMWKVRRLQESLSSDDQVAREEVDELSGRREQFLTNLASIAKGRAVTDDIRSSAMGIFLDLYTLFATLRQTSKSATDSTANTENHTRIRTLVSEIPPDQQTLLNSVFAASEKAFAKKSHRTLEAGDEDEPLDDDSDDESDEGANAEDVENEKRTAALACEQRLCELTGKIVLAIIAGVLDCSGPQAGKMKARLNQNRSRLGQNYKEIVAYLDEPKARKGKKRGAASGKSEASKKSEHIVIQEAEDEDGDDIEEVPEQVEEGGNEDLRARELLEDDIDMDDSGDGEAAGGEVDDEIIIGD